jgi:hypothetical protein
MNNRHARALGIEWRSKPPPDAFHFQAPFVWPVNAREYFAQGAFACAIFTHNCMATTGTDTKTHVLERNRSRKPFADALKSNSGIGRFGAQGNKLQQVWFTDWGAAAEF